MDSPGDQDIPHILCIRGADRAVGLAAQGSVDVPDIDGAARTITIGSGYSPFIFAASGG